MKSLGLLIGAGICNANCVHCAGKELRKYAPDEDGIFDDKSIIDTVKLCHSRGARSLSISSSGEPTLSPKTITKVLEKINELKQEGIEFQKIHIYSNGIRIGNDEQFCQEYLSCWKNLGVDYIYLTVHSFDLERNAQIYGIKKYPQFEIIIDRIHEAGLKVRANLILSNKTIRNFNEFVITIEELMNIGIDSAAAWNIRDINDEIDRENGLSDEEIEKMRNWVRGIKNIKVMKEEESQLLYENNDKLTLFPDGSLSSRWCRCRE